MADQEQTTNQANNADPLVGVTVAQAVERLRARLIDLSSRNRLLSYRHPKGRCVQIVDEPNLNLVFDRLYVDAKGLPFMYVPEPAVDGYEGKRPEARLHAERLGILTSVEFASKPAVTDGRHLHQLQTLYYPADLERQLRKIAAEGRTAIEETGTNMLFLVFGFLEFYDSDDSERPMLAPLLSLPVALNRGGIDPETRTYIYTVAHNGEDLADNYTLYEKLRRDFMLVLPEVGEEEKPEAYFVRIERAIKNKRRWKVRRQITLGLLSFGKLAMWADLDTKRNPGLLEHELIKLVLCGGPGGGGEGALHAEDHRIDNILSTQQLVFDADSAQHSAIIDVLAGKNLVINGPPGTGKSQTITNIIAAALSLGRKVLFVSEKLAALEVVRHRLNHAGLGHFCLELHSHKTQKKKFLEDIQKRIDERFSSPPMLEAKMNTLRRKRNDLARYAELMGSRLGNALGFTIHEVFWAAERRRHELGAHAAAVNTVGFPIAAEWTYDDIQVFGKRLADLAALYEAIGRFDPHHPWWGFRARPLAPGDDELIAQIIADSLAHATEADRAAQEAVTAFGFEEQPDAGSARDVRQALSRVPRVPDGADPTLLTKMFPATDPKGQSSQLLLSEISSGVTKARTLLESAAKVLNEGERLKPDDLHATASLAQERLSSVFLSSDLAAAFQQTTRLKQATKTFAAVVGDSKAPYGPVRKAELDAFLTNCSNSFVSELDHFPIQALSAKSRAVIETTRSLSGALSKIETIATRHGLPFEATPEAIAGLADSGGFPGLRREANIDAEALAEARGLAEHPLSDKPLREIDSLTTKLAAEIASIEGALFRCGQAVERLGLSFNVTEPAVAEASALATVAAAAPKDLLEYRQQTFGHARTTELIEKIRSSLTVEHEARRSLDDIFYLDALPPIAEIWSAVSVLRQNGTLFAFLDSKRRKAKKLYADISKEKRRISAKQRSDELASLARWIEARNALNSNSEMKESFRGLFRGVETDADKLARLNDWYLSSRVVIAECPGLTDKVDLSSLPADRIAELAAKAVAIQADARLLAEADAVLRNTIGADVAGFKEARAEGWGEGISCLKREVERLGRFSGFFARYVDRQLSPKDALRFMEARAELDGAAQELGLLQAGKVTIREAGGEEIGRLASLANGSWKEALHAILTVASLVAETATQATAFANEASSLSLAEGFAKAKANLDHIWSSVAVVPGWDHFTEWDGQAIAAESDADVAERVLSILSRRAKAGVSMDDVFRAFFQESEAHSILSQLVAFDEVRKLLGDLFQGANTDLSRLSETHAWGQSACAIDLPDKLRRHLLSDNAREALDTARRLYDAIDIGCSAVKESMERLTSHGSFFWEEWQKQARSVAGRDLPSEIRSRLEAVRNAPSSVLPWAKYLALRQQCREDGFVGIVSALESGKIPSAAVATAFELAAFQSIGRAIYVAHPELARFNGKAHERTRADYRALDAEIISLTGKDFACQIDRGTKVPPGQRGATVGDFTDLQLLRREINKQRRHIPIRQLVKRAGRALQELKPCFMMGPLSVAQYLEQGALNQLKPEDALGAIARGSQLVVVGDPKQLPPTSFFDRMMDSEDEDLEEEPAVTGMESILDVCQQLFTPTRSLRWHYRSHHESLIAFSNHHFYKNLIVFPSPYSANAGLGVKYRYVRNGVYKDRQNIPEAQHLVDAVLEHMLKRSNESLGVVTLNQTQRELIEELLYDKLKIFPEGADFVERWEAEGWPFFVKNLENVQGDERDVIFISTTFGKTPGTDKPRQNFGPISRLDGWRRLNVLFTRSKRRIELFTSMVPEDIIVDEKTPLGTKTLRDYLDFAKRGVLVATDEGDREPDSDFEKTVANVVESMGYEVKAQLGVAGFFIDIVVRNPDRPGEFLAAIECDGATYHRGWSVRDRDRIRQEILESLGWRGKIHRIWSTDWFFNPLSEKNRLRSFLEERRRLSPRDEPIGSEEGHDSPDTTAKSDRSQKMDQGRTPDFGAFNTILDM
jgi:Protein of unknown function (DUF4011)/REase_MTES_1575/AAA domain